MADRVQEYSKRLDEFFAGASPVTAAAAGSGFVATAAAVGAGLGCIFAAAAGVSPGEGVAYGLGVATLSTSVGAGMAIIDRHASEGDRTAGFAGLCTGGAIAVAGSFLAPMLIPAEVPASNPATTLVAEGSCEGIKTELPDSTGGMVKIILPQGCTLKFAP